jgi:hypothetical protein
MHSFQKITFSFHQAQKATFNPLKHKPQFPHQRTNTICLFYKDHLDDAVRKVTAVYSENNMKLISTLCGAKCKVSER